MVKYKSPEDVKAAVDIETVKVVASGVVESSVPADIAKPGAVKKVGKIVIQTF